MWKIPWNVRYVSFVPGMIALQEQVRRLEDELGRVSRAGTEKQTATVCPEKMNDCDGSGSDDVSGNAGTNDTI